MVRRGSQLDQRDLEGQTALEIILELSRYDGAMCYGLRRSHRRPNAACRMRMRVECALLMLSHGAQAPNWSDLQTGNNLCFTCVAEYGDAMLACVVRRAVGNRDLPQFYSHVAEFLHASK